MKKNVFHCIESLCAKLTSPYNRSRLPFVLFILFFISISMQQVSGQIVKHYADEVTEQSHVDNASNALGETGFATLNSYGGLLLGGGGFTGKLTLKFDDIIPAGKTTYVKIDSESDVLNLLLGGNLGGALADLLGNVVLGDHYFTVEASIEYTPVLSGNSKDGFTNNLRLIINSSGDYLLAITPNVDYNQITIEDHTDALLLGTDNKMNVHYAYYTTGEDICENAYATSFTGTGGTIDVLGLGANGVTTPENAIDNNEATFSKMSLGLLTVAGSISQTIYFQSPSSAQDQFHLTLQLDDSSALSLNLLKNSITIEALLGNQLVESYQLNEGLLNLNVLNLLNSYEKVTLPFSPEAPFDKIRITLSSTVELNLTRTIKIYGAYRSVGVPFDIEAPDTVICYEENATLSAATDPENDLVWYAAYDEETPIATTNSNETYTTHALTENDTIYVAAKRCSDIESERIPIYIEIAPDYGHPDITIENITN